MNWIAIVLWIITNAPDIIALVKQVIDLFQSLPKRDREQAKAEIGAAIEQAKKTGDKRPVKELFEKLHNRCSGVACAPQTLKP